LLSRRSSSGFGDRRTDAPRARSVDHDISTGRSIRAPHEHVIHTRSFAVPLSRSPHRRCSAMKAVEIEHELLIRHRSEPRRSL